MESVHTWDRNRLQEKIAGSMEPSQGTEEQGDQGVLEKQLGFKSGVEQQVLEKNR
jgi:hypothetical protein